MLLPIRLLGFLNWHWFVLDIYKYEIAAKRMMKNMALASLMGIILSAWYAQVHRAKGFDPNRLLLRRSVFRRLTKFREQLISATTDDRIMGKVWGKGQQWNFPFGKGAKGGKFV